MSEKKSAIVRVRGSHKNRTIDNSLPKLFDREEVRLTHSRQLDLKANGDSKVLDYLLGSAYVAAKDIKPETMGQIAVAIFWHASGAYDQISRHCRTKTIDEALLNAENSELVTPPGQANLGKDLQLKSLFHFKLEAKVLDGVGNVIGVSEKQSPDRETGDYIVFTEDGVYRWIYTYTLSTIPGVHHDYPKNVASNARFMPCQCDFVNLDSAGFAELFRGKPDLFMNLMHRVGNQLRQELGELARIQYVSSDHLEKITSMLGKIRYR